MGLQYEKSGDGVRDDPSVEEIDAPPGAGDVIRVVGGEADRGAVGLQLFVDALIPADGFGAVLVVARPEADPVPGFRELAAGVRLPGDR